MGTLVVMKYSTSMFGNLADHTYVQCGTGRKGWSCWGGKTGGTELRRAPGSTKRADAIAGPDERAGIKCYLINGVCHQAANRILLTAGIRVNGARGYYVSEALYGPYGRPSGPFGTCLSPFNQYPNVTGDLPECIETQVTRRKATRKALTRLTEKRKSEDEYIKGVLAIYRKYEGKLRSAKNLISRDLAGLALELFMYQVEYSLGSKLDNARSNKLRDIRLSTELSRMKLEDMFTNHEMKASEFVDAFNKETILFQEAAAGVLKASDYKRLFGLKPGETVILADPRIVKKVYGSK